MAGPSPVYLITGDDPSLTDDAQRRLVAELVGDDDPAFAVEDLESGEDADIAPVLDAAQTPPFLVARRVVVVRDVGRFAADAIRPLVAYLDDPLPSTVLVLVAGGGRTPRALFDAVKRAGQVVDAGVPSGKGRLGWVAGQVRHSGVRIDRAAVALVAEHLGEDVGRLRGLLETLAAAYGQETTVGVDEVTPFLGRAGAVAPWDLTDPIDKGDTACALAQLRRMLGDGTRHPLAVLAALHRHYRQMLRLEGAEMADERQAAAALGLAKSTYPAKKALEQSRRLGHDGVSRAIELLAEADIALKGGLDWPGELVLEVLVARLSRLGPRTADSRR